MVHSEVSQTIVNRGGWLWNSTKFFVVCVSSLFLALTVHKKTIVVYHWPRNWPTGMFWLCNSCIVYEGKQIIVQGRGPSNINLGIFVCSVLWCLPGFSTIPPLLNMVSTFSQGLLKDWSRTIHQRSRTHYWVFLKLFPSCSQLLYLLRPE